MNPFSLFSHFNRNPLPELTVLPAPERLPHENLLDEVQGKIIRLERRRDIVRDEIAKARELEQSLTDSIDALDSARSMLLSLSKVEAIAEAFKDEPLPPSEEFEA